MDDREHHRRRATLELKARAQERHMQTIARVQQLQAERENRAMDECTFTPNTNHLNSVGQPNAAFGSGAKTSKLMARLAQAQQGKGGVVGSTPPPHPPGSSPQRMSTSEEVDDHFLQGLKGHYGNSPEHGLGNPWDLQRSRPTQAQAAATRSTAAAANNKADANGSQSAVAARGAMAQQTQRMRQAHRRGKSKSENVRRDLTTRALPGRALPGHPGRSPSDTHQPRGNGELEDRDAIRRERDALLREKQQWLEQMKAENAQLMVVLHEARVAKEGLLSEMNMLATEKLELKVQKGDLVESALDEVLGSMPIPQHEAREGVSGSLRTGADNAAIMRARESARKKLGLKPIDSTVQDDEGGDGEDEDGANISVADALRRAHQLHSLLRGLVLRLRAAHHESLHSLLDRVKGLEEQFLSGEANPTEMEREVVQQQQLVGQHEALCKGESVSVHAQSGRPDGTERLAQFKESSDAKEEFAALQKKVASLTAMNKALKSNLSTLRRFKAKSKMQDAVAAFGGGARSSPGGEETAQSSPMMVEDKGRGWVSLTRQMRDAALVWIDTLLDGIFAKIEGAAELSQASMSAVREEVVEEMAKKAGVVLSQSNNILALQQIGSAQPADMEKVCASVLAMHAIELERQAMPLAAMFVKYAAQREEPTNPIVNALERGSQRAAKRRDDEEAPPPPPMDDDDDRPPPPPPQHQAF